MVERQNPLRTTLRSVLNSLQPVASGDERALNNDGFLGSSDSIRRRSVKLSAGILRCHSDGNVKLDSLDDSALIGLSIQLLKKLSINSVVINTIEIGIQRIGQVVVLDPPPKSTPEDAFVGSSVPISDSLHTMIVFPTYDLTQQEHTLLLDQEVAYLSPMFAFNLSLHVSCLKSLVHRGNEVLERYFEAKFDEELNGKSTSKIGLDLESTL